MLTESLIKPFIEDLEQQGIEDTTPHEQGFMAGMAALSSILSEHVDNKAQLFVYLGMSISEGMQWVEGQAMERDNVISIFAEQPQRKRKTTTSPDLWDYVSAHGDLSASFIQKYKGKDVFFAYSKDYTEQGHEGKAIFDLCNNRLQVIDMNGTQIQRPYYIKLR